MIAKNHPKIPENKQLGSATGWRVLLDEVVHNRPDSVEAPRNKKVIAASIMCIMLLIVSSTATDAL